MLTAQDLSAIGNIVDEKLDKRFVDFETRFDKKMDEKLDTRFAEFEIRFEKKIDEKLDRGFTEFKIRFEKKLDSKLNEKFKKKLLPIERHLKRIDRKINMIVDYFDKNDWLHQRRLVRIENHLHLQPLEL